MPMLTLQEEIETSQSINHFAFEYYEVLRRVKLFVEQHYNEDLGVGEAAEIAAMEKKYFSAFFRQKVGIGFMDWVNSLRVTKALIFLKEKNYTILEVSQAVGFADITTFERRFKQFTQMTPLAFKIAACPCSGNGGNRGGLRGAR